MITFMKDIGDRGLILYLCEFLYGCCIGDASCSFLRKLWLVLCG